MPLGSQCSITTGCSRTVRLYPRCCDFDVSPDAHRAPFHLRPAHAERPSTCAQPPPSAHRPDFCVRLACRPAHLVATQACAPRALFNLVKLNKTKFKSTQRARPAKAQEGHEEVQKAEQKAWEDAVSSPSTRLAYTRLPDSNHCWTS